MKDTLFSKRRFKIKLKHKKYKRQPTFLCRHKNTKDAQNFQTANFYTTKEVLKTQKLKRKREQRSKRRNFLIYILSNAKALVKFENRTSEATKENKTPKRNYFRCLFIFVKIKTYPSNSSSDVFWKRLVWFTL